MVLVVVVAVVAVEEFVRSKKKIFYDSCYLKCNFFFHT